MRLSIVLLAGLAVSACSKGGEAPAAGAAPGSKAAEASKAPATQAAPAGPNMVKIDKLGLQAEAPGGTKAGDAIIGTGAMLQGPGLVLTVEAASDTRPKTLDDAKKESEMYSPKNVNGEALPDGFILTYENEGGMGKNFFVQSRRKIGDKDIWCETTASQPEQSANAVKACKSLKP
jgi:hypothetical protein